MDWDDSGLIPGYGDPLPKWSVRVLDAYSPAFAQQADSEFGQLDPARLLKLLRASKRQARIGRTSWDLEQPRDRGVEVSGIMPDPDKLSRLDFVNMWLRAAYFLRKGYTTSELGDGQYLDYRRWFGYEQRDPEADAAMEEWRNDGTLPHFEPALVVHKAPLV